jgi:CBS domain-containing protein
MTTLASLCKQPVQVVIPGTTIRAAAELMREHHVGALIVTGEDGGASKPQGILTDRDIVVGIVALGLDPNVFLIDDLLDRPLTVARAEQSVHDGLKLMKAKGVRRLPLVDKDGNLAGIVTLDDLFGELARDMSRASDIVEREIGVEVALRHRAAGKRHAKGARTSSP